MITDFSALNRLVDQWGEFGPGVVAAMRWAGREQWFANRGLASVQSGVPLTGLTRIRVGSVTKQFVCALLVMAAEEGALSVDDRAIDYLPDLSPAFADVRIRHLMTHTSGTPDNLIATLVANGPGSLLPMSDDEVWAAVRRSPRLNFAPGERFTYSNGGFVILTRLIEAVAGRPLEEQLDERLFKPIGMMDTALVRTDAVMEPGLAASHLPLPDGRFLRGQFGMSVGGEGGCVSTVGDLMLWLAHADEPVAFAPSVWERMSASVSFANGHVSHFRHGIIYDRWRGVDLYYHDGGVFGGAARILKAPALGLDLVVLTNRGDVSVRDLSRAMIDCAAHDRLDPPSAAPSVLRGLYASFERRRLVRFADADGRAVVEIAGTAAPLAQTDGRLVADGVELANLTFRPDESGDTPASIDVSDCGEVITLHRLGPVEVVPDGSGIAGRYRSMDLDADASLEHEADRWRLVVSGKSGHVAYRLEWIDANIAVAHPVVPTALRPTLYLDSAGDGFTFQTWRNPAVSFHRHTERTEI